MGMNKTPKKMHNSASKGKKSPNDKFASGDFFSKNNFKTNSNKKPQTPKNNAGFNKFQTQDTPRPNSQMKPKFNVPEVNTFKQQNSNQKQNKKQNNNRSNIKSGLPNLSQDTSFSESPAKFSKQNQFNNKQKKAVEATNKSESPVKQNMHHHQKKLNNFEKNDASQSVKVLRITFPYGQLKSVDQVKQLVPKAVNIKFPNVAFAEFSTESEADSVREQLNPLVDDSRLSSVSFIGPKEQNYRKKSQSVEKLKLYVRGIGKASETDIRKLFPTCSNVVILGTFKGGRDRKFCFVSFASEEACEQALNKSKGLTLFGKTLSVGLAFKSKLSSGESSDDVSNSKRSQPDTLVKSNKKARKDVEEDQEDSDGSEMQSEDDDEMADSSDEIEQANSMASLMKKGGKKLDLNVQKKNSKGGNLMLQDDDDDAEEEDEDEDEECEDEEVDSEENEDELEDEEDLDDDEEEEEEDEDDDE